MRLTHRLLTLLTPRGGTPEPGTFFAMTCMIAEANQTLTINALNATGGNTFVVSWGDGLANEYGGTGARTHQYAAAGTYTVIIHNTPVLGAIDLRDGKLSATVTDTNQFPQVSNGVILFSPFSIAWTVAPERPFPQVNGYVNIQNQPNLIWNISPENPPPPVTNYLNLIGIGLTWESGAAANLHSAGVVNVKSNLNQSAVDTVLGDLYAYFAARTKAGTIDLSGTGNAAPSGTLQAACPPTSGKEYAYELVNDSCGVSGFHWTSVSIAS